MSSFEEYYNIQKPNSKYFNLEIATISTCSMACTYCFEGDELQTKKKQHVDNIPNIINKIEVLLESNNFNKEYPDGICINFWGGEPTLNLNWNMELIKVLKSKPYYNRISFFIYTNGFDYTKLTQHLDLFTPTEMITDKIRIQISWDGIDNGRVDHSSKPTNTRIKDNILKVIRNYNNLNLSTKATIQPQELLRLQEIWENHFKLFLEHNASKYGDRARITFSPTLNYVDDFDDTDPEYLEAISKQFAIILKLEEKFYAKYKFNLFGWFSSNQLNGRQKRLTNCSAGVNILALDYDGSFTTCHGALYSPNKDDFKKLHNINLSDTKPNFTKKFFESRESVKKNLEYVDNSCITCSATTCYKCPIVNIEQLSKDGIDFDVNNYQVRDTRHCSIYKLFGKFDRIMFGTILPNINKNK